ncbi:hypothetical protein HQ535_10495 [bacterium]|nr:hypothetical protein [bacterium]
MYSTLRHRHWKILGSLLVTVSIGLSFFTGVLGAKRINDGSGFERSQLAYEQQVHLNEMWQIIEGDLPRPPGTEAYTLLADRLATVVDGAPSSGDITTESYTAPPRTYRGITSEIGFDPFDSELCNECGDLNQYMVERLRDIKDGRLPSLIEAVEAPVNDVGWGFTALPFWLELFVVWQIFGAIGMAWGLSRYGDRDMTWRFNDGEDDNLEWACLVFAPVFMITFLATYNRRNNRRNEQARLEMLRSLGLTQILLEIEDALRNVKKMPESIRNRPEVQRQLERLEAARLEIRDIPDELQARQLGVYEDSVARSLGDGTALDDLLGAAQRAFDGYLSAVEEISEIPTPEL